MRTAWPWLGLALLAACGAAGKKAAATAAQGGGNEDLHIPKVDESLCDAKGKRVATFDLNQDGKPDVWKLYDEHKDKSGAERMTCKQVDLNHDGKKDYAAQYDASGNLILEEYDFDFDEKFDARVHFDPKTGKMYASEHVSGFGGAPDVWEKYGADEKLEARRRDRNGDGRPDYFEQWLGGALDEILYDDNFDGKIDRKEEAHPGRDLGAAAAAAGEATPALGQEPDAAPGESKSTR